MLIEHSHLGVAQHDHHVVLTLSHPSQIPPSQSPH
jgi:hypothetical protein